MRLLATEAELYPAMISPPSLVCLPVHAQARVYTHRQLHKSQMSVSQLPAGKDITDS